MEPPNRGSSSSSSSSSAKILHQRQRLQLCLMHALNNLFQGETVFSRRELDSIAQSLSSTVKHGYSGPLSCMFSPHYNVITGNYDANVLMIALQNRNAEALWYDRRKGATSMVLENPDKKLVGIILNNPTTRYSTLWKGRHWSALKKIDGAWYDLDSYLSAPSLIATDDEQVKHFLNNSFASGSEAFLVLKAETAAVRAD